ncbi:DNA adenine methylase [Vibrio splendidus]
MSTSFRPLVKWVGGKHWVTETVSRLFQQSGEDNFIETFCGGMALGLNINAKRTIMNDRAPHLINLYKQIQQRNFTEVNIDCRNQKSVYLAHRKRLNELFKEGQHNTAEAAEIMLYLNHHGYNGLFRVSLTGNYNVPFGSYAKVNMEYDLTRYADLFQTWEFHCGSYENIEHRGFRVYDPPYHDAYQEYTQQRFNDDDQEDVFIDMDKRDDPMVYMNKNTPYIRSLLEKYGLEYVVKSKTYSVSRQGDGRTPKEEVFAWRNIPDAKSIILV